MRRIFIACTSQRSSLLFVVLCCWKGNLGYPQAEAKAAKAAKATKAAKVAEVVEAAEAAKAAEAAEVALAAKVAEVAEAGEAAEAASGGQSPTICRNRLLGRPKPCEVGVVVLALIQTCSRFVTCVKKPSNAGLAGKPPSQ